MFDSIHRRRLRVQKRFETESKESLSKMIAVPEGAYLQCSECRGLLERVDLRNRQFVCPHCDFHHRMHCLDRIQLLFDSFDVFNHRMISQNPLDFPHYEPLLESLSESMGVYDAVVTGIGHIGKRKVIGIVMDSFFIMGSMGSVVGEKITRALEKAIEMELDVIIVTASGGARMQEGIVSLMQMAKVSIAVNNFQNAGGFMLNILTDPTTGGVTASFAMQGDIILAEPNALISLAGPRVIQQTIRQPLPEGSLRSERLMACGFVDRVVHRSLLKETVSQILEYHGGHLWIHQK